MSSIIPGFEYDVFISYRQKDNKHDGWVTEFVNQLKGELESTFKEEISVYFDINPTDGLLETHDVDASLKDKLKCLVFIPIISRTYCDPRSFAWEHEFKAFVEQASKDRFGLKIKLPNGNVASRVLPVRIHDLDIEDIKLCETLTGGVLRSIDFIYKSVGVNRPLRAHEDHPHDNLNKTFYRDQLNKVANAIEELIHSLKKAQLTHVEEKQQETLAKDNKSYEIQGLKGKAPKNQNLNKWLITTLILILCISGGVAVLKIIHGGRQPNDLSKLEKSIAVLPFINDSPDTNNVYFCNGMMEDILNHLVKINDLDVKSRTDVEPYRGIKKSRNDIAKELGVAYLLEGSVRKQGNSFRLMVQLIDARTGFHKWSQPYEGIYSDTIFIIQSEIAKKVAEALNALISSEEKEEIEKLPTTDIRSYDYYIIADQEINKYWMSGDINCMKKAQDLLDKALKIDPKFEKALGAKGGTFLAYQFQQYDSVFKYSEKLLSLNSKSSQGYFLRGEYFRFVNNAEPAIEAYKNALKYYSKNEIESFRQTEFFIGHLYCENMSDYKNGLPYIQKAYDFSSVYITMTGLIFATIGDYVRADKYHRQSLNVEILPANAYLYAQTLMVQSRFSEALKMLDTVCKQPESLLLCAKSRLCIHISMKEFDKAQQDLEVILNSGNKLWDKDSIFVAYLYKNTGRKKESLEMMKRSLNSFKNQAKKDKGFYPLFFISSIYAMLGERDKALDYLSKSVNAPSISGMHDYIEIFPPFENLRDDPEFKAIVKRAKDEKARLREEIKQIELLGEIDL